MRDDASLAFRERLRELRHALDLSQEELAERASLNYKHYQEIERGAKREVRLSTIIKLAKALGIPLYQLFTDEPAAAVLAEVETSYRFEPRTKQKKKR